MNLIISTKKLTEYKGRGSDTGCYKYLCENKIYTNVKIDTSLMW